MSDQGSTGGDIYLVSSNGGEPKDVTPGRKASPAWFLWIDDHTLGISEITGGSSHLFGYNLNTQQDDDENSATFPEGVGSGQQTMSVSVAGDNQIALIRSSYSAPPEVWAGKLNDLKQITHYNDNLKPSWGKSESVSWQNEGFDVQGWLLYPANYDPSKKYPLIVMVHGGPSAAVTPRWPGAGFGGAPFSALGYFVLMPNPRGSYGQGEKFTQANRKDFGYGDLRDILAGVDTVTKKYPVDPERVGITGWSYGGFMTMFAVTQTNRFHAAVAGAGIANWQSYYGENSIDQWMIPFFGASVYDDPAVYAKSSAINFIKQGQDADAGRRRRPRRRMPRAAVLRVLARAARPACPDRTRRLPQRRPSLRLARSPARCARTRPELVPAVHARAVSASSKMKAMPGCRIGRGLLSIPLVSARTALYSRLAYAFTNDCIAALRSGDWFQ